MISVHAAEVLPAASVEDAESTAFPLSRARRRPSLADRISITGWRLIALVVFLGLWHLASIPAGKLLLPSPVDIVPAFIDVFRTGQLVNATLSSLSVFIVGYLLAIV